jgi:hypothetical protein
MSCWNCWPAFFNKSGICRNSNKPDGLITAVLGIFFAATGKIPFSEVQLAECSWEGG